MYVFSLRMFYISQVIFNFLKWECKFRVLTKIILFFIIFKEVKIIFSVFMHYLKQPDALGVLVAFGRKLTFPI